MCLWGNMQISPITYEWNCWGIDLLHFTGWLSGKISAYQCRGHRKCGFNPWIRKILWRRKWQPTPVLLPEKSNEQRSLVGYHRVARSQTWLSTHTQVMPNCFPKNLCQLTLPTQFHVLTNIRYYQIFKKYIEKLIVL